MNPTERAETNKANSQHSTGPKTAEGKRKSSLNALRHGLTGQIVVMPGEDLVAYQLHIEAYTQEYDPKGATETDLVHALADTSWRLNRVAALESNVLALAAALETHTKALANLSMHSQRLSRQYEKTVILLRQLQQTRRAQENSQINNMLDIMEIYEKKGEAYDPTEDGFVFSDLEIDNAIRARNREFLREEALEHAAA